MPEITLRKTQIARVAIERHFKAAFHKAMQRYAPIKDGWLQSCGMFRVTARWVGSDYRAIQIVVDERPKYMKDERFMYWRAVENGSTLPRAKRLWILDRVGEGHSRSNETARLVLTNKTGDGRNEYYYKYKHVSGGTFEDARVTEKTKSVGWASFNIRKHNLWRNSAYGKYENKGWPGRKEGVQWGGLVGQRRMWSTTKAYVRRGRPFISAVCMDAVESTRRAIDSMALRTYTLKPRLLHAGLGRGADGRYDKSLISITRAKAARRELTRMGFEEKHQRRLEYLKQYRRDRAQVREVKPKVEKIERDILRRPQEYGDFKIDSGAWENAWERRLNILRSNDYDIRKSFPRAFDWRGQYGRY